MSAEPGMPKRRCVSTACIACRRRKSKCDGNLPSCAACSSVYHTPCVYDPNSDHRRKGVYKKDADTLRTKHTTLQTLIQALLNYDEEDAFELVRQIRSCDDLEDVAQSVLTRDRGLPAPTIEAVGEMTQHENAAEVDQFESELSGRMSELLLDGSRKFIGGTSNLIFLPPGSELHEFTTTQEAPIVPVTNDMLPVRRWTQATEDDSLVSHLLTMYFTWHYPFFTILAKDMFYRDYVRGVSSPYCSALLVNAMLALGCHFTTWRGAFSDPNNLATAGDHFFKEAKRMVLENDEHENAKLCTVQAFALMSVREAGCGREGKGWVYSGLSFRMAFDLGLNVDAATPGSHNLTEEEIDARRITFWGCYLIDKCWSNYLGRQPQLSSSNTNIPKFEVFPSEETELWAPYTDAGAGQDHSQPSRTRAVALQISILCQISGDLLAFFYHPSELEKLQPKQSELKKLSDVHTRLEAWKKQLPREFEPKEGQLPQVLVMQYVYQSLASSKLNTHSSTSMFNQLLLIHLYRPFLKYTKTNTPLPSHVSPRKICTQAASAISKLLRMYKRTYGLKQICNVVVYIAHTACTIHLLNLPEKNAQRDIVHGLRNLEEMAECWLCARRTLRILDISANKWHVPLPIEASAVFERTHTKWGSWGLWDQATSPTSVSDESPATSFSNLSPSVNSPGRFSPGDNKAPAVQRPEPATTNTATLSRVSMAPQYPPATTMPPSVPPMRVARRYLLGLQVQIHPLLPSQAIGTMQAEPMQRHNLPHPACHLWLILGGPESLVRESQGWWSRNATAMDIGVENWSPWSPEISAPVPHLQYGNGHVNLVAMAPQPNTANGHQNQAEASTGMHSASLSPENGTPKFDGPWS
ncbi:transcriptional regulator family: Fungal Specific TF [Penicillium manginii]|uniref:transcriptional regulator family: Fungal Specific TF n=1 Tax=Penicillium manginii TaxID=203109 RepID=UPI002546A0CF|nr:transcriptional regulator family: Fungal Specific TF [Penicillium manginii]KAJ5764424.1 transcriptional regulator family: Fungal Specific TF [Penicillium manginii]